MKNRNASFALIVLFFVNMLNYADRYILPAVLPKIRIEFGLNLFQEGLLGTSFVIVFALSSLPLSMLADRSIRKNIIAVCVGAWSIMTMLGGVIHTFKQLFVVRSFLGIGEAGYSPASLSLLGDYAESDNRGKVLSFFLSGNLIGAAFGFIIGGILAEFLGWRYAFFLVGLPGLILAYLSYRITEPGVQVKKEKIEAPIKIFGSIAKVKTYWAVIFAYVFYAFVLGGVSFWLPTYLHDVFHLNLAKGGLLTGILLLTSGTIGVVGGGWISDRLYHSNKYSRLYVPVVGGLIGSIFVFFALIAHSVAVFSVIVFLGGICLSSASGPLYVVMHDVIKPHMRSSAFGLSFLLSHLLGDASAPSLIGSIANKTSLHTSLLLTTPLFLLFAAFCCVIGMKTIRKDMDAIATLEK